MKQSVVVILAFPGYARGLRRMLTYTIDKARGLVTVLGTGVVTTADLRDLQQRGRADPEFDPTHRILLDLTAADLQGWTSNDVRAIAGRGVNTRRAILVSTDLGYGTGRMLQAETGMLGQRNVQVFRDRAAALSWLLETADRATG
jgi:hypothetical protein